MQKNKMPVPTEAQEQMTLFSWAAGKKTDISPIIMFPTPLNTGSR